MQRQDSLKNQEMILKFLNFCAILIQKNVKGYIQRQRHKIIMMHIRRFKAILNGFIQGYRTRQIMKVPDVAKLRQNIIETDDGTYGNPQIRQKKVRLIRMIENYLQNGQFYKKLKRVKSSQKQFVPNQWLENEFVSQDQQFQQNYYKKPQKQPLQQNKVEQQYYDQLIQNEYSEPQTNYQEYIQQQSQMHEISHSNSNQSGYQRFDYQQDERPIRSKNQQNFAVQEKPTFERNPYNDERPIGGKGKYDYAEDDRPINGKNSNSQTYYDDERPITSKNTNNYYEDDRPISGKNNNEQNYYEDERPIKKGKDKFKQEQEQYQDDDRPIASIGKYQQFEDERPLGGKGQYNIPVDDMPINGKGTYGNFEEEAPPPKKQKQPQRKKNEQKKDKQIIDDRQQNMFDNQNENEPPFGRIQDEDQNDQEKPKQKKKDPKLLENLKKRTKYDPRKAIQEAKKKQEEQQQMEQAEVEEIVEQQEKEVLPQQQQQIPQKKQVLSQKNLQDKEQSLQSPKSSKVNLSATPERQTPSKEQVGECSPKDDASDQKPKNFLKRKSKQIPLKNPKVDPKTVKSKVKNCWNAGNAMEDPECDGNEDIPQSPKAYINNKSPSRRFEQKGQDQQFNYQQQQLQQQQLLQQQQQQQQQIQQNKSQGPLHVQVQLVQENQSQYQINPSHQVNQMQQQKKQSIQLDELERAYYSKYTQKLETTKMNLKVLDQERSQNSRGVPIITTKSRFFTSFRVNDFERLLAQLEDQYNKLQISK